MKLTVPICHLFFSLPKPPMDRGLSLQAASGRSWFPLHPTHNCALVNLSPLHLLGWVLCWSDLQGEVCAVPIIRAFAGYLGEKQMKKKNTNPIHLQYCHMHDMLLHTVPSKMRMYKFYGCKNLHCIGDKLCMEFGICVLNLNLLTLAR